MEPRPLVCPWTHHRILPEWDQLAQARWRMQALHLTMVCLNMLWKFVVPTAASWGMTAMRIPNVRFTGENEVSSSGLHITQTAGLGTPCPT